MVSQKKLNFADLCKILRIKEEDYDPGLYKLKSDDKFRRYLSDSKYCGVLDPVLEYLRDKLGKKNIRYIIVMGMELPEENKPEFDWYVAAKIDEKGNRKAYEEKKENIYDPDEPDVPDERFRLYLKLAKHLGYNIFQFLGIDARIKIIVKIRINIVDNNKKNTIELVSKVHDADFVGFNVNINKNQTDKLNYLNDSAELKKFLSNLKNDDNLKNFTDHIRECSQNFNFTTDTCRSFDEEISYKFDVRNFSTKNEKNLKLQDLLISHVFFMKQDPDCNEVYCYYIPVRMAYRCEEISQVYAVLSVISNDEVDLTELEAAGLLIQGAILRVVDEKRNANAIRHAENAIRHALRSAAANILIESYAHNIGAHGLEGLKTTLLKKWDSVRREILKGGENESLLRIREKLLTNMKSFDDSILSILKTHSQLPEYVSYLQGKSAFWGAISRGGRLFGGEIRNVWYLIDGFARNNLLCGSLGASEKYRGIRFYVHYDNEVEIDLGPSDIDDDKRYRFEEEGLLDNEDKQKKAFLRRTQASVNSENFNKWEKLRDNLGKCEIFLPEGIVGQQAIYTIWENIIRNVKHCKKADHYIPFHIQIENEGECCKLTNWIDLEHKEEKAKLSGAVNEMNSWEGVLLEDGSTNMGGTSQNILCAGMVFVLDFLEAEKKQKKAGNEAIMDFKLIELVNGQQRIGYTFKIWKGSDWKKWKEIKGKEEAGPSGRYKIIILENEVEKEDFLENSSSVRHVVTNKHNEFPKLYQDWVQKFILSEDKYPKGIVIDHDLWNCWKFSYMVWKTSDNSNPCYRFHHGDPKGKEIEIDYKNDGIMRHFGNETNIKKNPALLPEFIEVVATKVDIYDNRLNGLYLNMEEKQRKLLEGLNVDVWEEKIEDEQTNPKKHFLVIHLSLVESLTGKKNTEAVENFFSKKKDFVDKYRFVIVTTGRGRDWMEGLSNNIKKKARFIPIENLERCFDEGGNLEPKSPAFGVKYALVKAIFGS